MATKTVPQRRKAAAQKRPVPTAKVVILPAEEPVSTLVTRQDIEIAALNHPVEGFEENLGDLIMKVIAPGVLPDNDSHPESWEPPEGATLRMLAMELDALAEWVDQGNGDHAELPNLLRQFAERAEASRELAYRVRQARFGTSPTWGGVTKTPMAGGAS